MKSDFYKVIVYDSLKVSKLDVHPSNKNIINAILFRSNLFLIEPLKQYDICVYIDGNVQIKNPKLISTLLKQINPDEYDIIISRPQHRNCVYTEAEFSMNISKYGNTDLSRQIEDYRTSGYPPNNGLYWNGFVIYLKPFAKHMQPFYDMYTQHMIQYVKNRNKHFHPQGQISFPFVLWKTKLKYYVIDKVRRTEHVSINSYN